MPRNNLPRQIIILGGGASVEPFIYKGLWHKLRGKWTLGVNYSYRFFDSTTQIFSDKLFYEREEENLKYLPLVVGRRHPNQTVLSNTIILPKRGYNYEKTYTKEGLLKHLAGIFTLALAIYLLKEGGEIYLLGYDFTALKDKNGNYMKDSKGRYITHWYQGLIEHRGIGKVSAKYFHFEGNANRDFEMFKAEQDIKIYNVCPESQITTFQKISYDEFFKKLDKHYYDGKSIREYMKRRLS